MALTREYFEGLKQRVEKVACLNANDVACIRTLTIRERDAYDASIDDGVRRNVDNISARLVCLCLCDEAGKLLFPDAKEGAAAIGKWPTSIVEPLYHECRKLNRMGKDAVEEAAKNFSPTPDDSSSSD